MHFPHWYDGTICCWLKTPIGNPLQSEGARVMVGGSDDGPPVASTDKLVAWNGFFTNNEFCDSKIHSNMNPNYFSRGGDQKQSTGPFLDPLQFFQISAHNHFKCKHFLPFSKSWDFVKYNFSDPQSLSHNIQIKKNLIVAWLVITGFGVVFLISWYFNTQCVTYHCCASIELYHVWNVCLKHGWDGMRHGSSLRRYGRRFESMN